MAQEKNYQVVIASPAQKRYQNIILSFLIQHFSLQRCIEIDQQLVIESKTLRDYPNRGRKEDYLSHLSEEYRFILFKPTKGLEIKIIYFIDEDSRKVYITDFFPTKMNPDSILK